MSEPRVRCARLVNDGNGNMTFVEVTDEGELAEMLSSWGMEGYGNVIQTTPQEAVAIESTESAAREQLFPNLAQSETNAVAKE